MKKLIFILLAMTVVFSLAACSGNPSSGRDASSEPPVSSSEPSSAPSEAPVFSVVPASDAPSSQPEESTEGGKTLVAYFSWSGNTQQMAEIIAQETGADLFEIATVTPYTDDYNTLLDVAQQEQGEDARPELNAQVENWDSYDTIFVGYPNWWSDAPMAVYTFLESYDWTGKTLIPFCTSGGSGLSGTVNEVKSYDFTGKTLIPFNTSASGGFGRSLTGIEESAAGATLLEGLDLTEGELGDVENRVTTWLDSLGLNG